MARQKSAAQWLQQLHRAGRTDREISNALGRGDRGTSFVQKVRTGRKSGGTLREPAKRLVQIQRGRETGTAKPLPTVTAPRRPQKLRPPQKLVSGEHAFYAGKRAGPGLQNRIIEAAIHGRSVQLTLHWARVQRYSRAKSAPDKITLWENGENAYEVLGQLDEAGYQADPIAALAVLTLDQHRELEDVEDLDDWTLHTF